MLRAIAAIMVVLHHAYPQYEYMGGKIQSIISISKWGFAGVDIFFVISGFIMAYTTFNKERNFQNAKTFIKHRFFRIYLGYWPFFFIMLFAVFVTNRQKLGSIDVVGSFFLTNANMFELVLPVSWSLSYELYFYFLFVFTFLFAIRQLYIIIPAFITFITAFIFVSFLNNELSRSFFYSPFILEFFTGVLLYMYRDFLIKKWMIPVLIVFIVASYALGVGYEMKYGLYRVITFGTGALFVVYLAIILEEKNIYKTGKFLKSVGDASYTLYLSHLIIIQLFFYSGLRYLFTASGSFIPLFGLILLVFLCIYFSLFYYRWIEKPIYQKAINMKGIL